MLTADPKKASISSTWKYTSPLISCAFDPKNRYLFSSAEDYSLQRWEIATGKHITWQAHESWVNDIAVHPSGDFFVSAGCDDTIIFWNTLQEKQVPLKAIKAHTGWVRAVSFSSDGKYLVSTGNDGLVKLWNVSDYKLIQTFSGHQSDVYSAIFHPDGKWLLSGDLVGNIHQWEITTGKLVRSFDAKELMTDKSQGVRYGGVRSLAISPDRKHIACSGLHKATNPLGAVNEPVVLQFNWESGKKVKTHTDATVKGIGWNVFYLPDGSLVCATGGSGGGFLVFWKAEDEKVFHRLKLPNTSRDMDLHPESLQVVTAHHDRQIRVTCLYEKPAGKK
ncbi:MAG: WD40 repeat domain-containing protein [Zavarzinella sp.]